MSRSPVSGTQAGGFVTVTCWSTQWLLITSIIRNVGIGYSVSDLGGSAMMTQCKSASVDGWNIVQRYSWRQNVWWIVEECWQLSPECHWPSGSSWWSCPHWTSRWLVMDRLLPAHHDREHMPQLARVAVRFHSLCSLNAVFTLKQLKLWLGHIYPCSVCVYDP